MSDQVKATSTMINILQNSSKVAQKGNEEVKLVKENKMMSQMTSQVQNET